MEVSIAEILGIEKRLREINSVPFDEIEFVIGGAPIEITDKMREEWKYIGLTNASFISMGFYLDNEIK